jgi:molecular chaperone GrpE
MVKKQVHVDKTEASDLHNGPDADQSASAQKEEDLMSRLREKEREAEENYDKYLRAEADLDNYRKRAARDRADAVKYGHEGLLKDILPLVDSLERASQQACNAKDMEAFREGLKMVQDQLNCCLEKHGVQQIDAVGKDFDPNVHEAILQVESVGHEHNQVVDEFEKGYFLNGRLLRPAKVSVCRRAKPQDSDQG